MANVKVLLWFDVEDYITPQTQDAWYGLLQLLNAKNVTGIFKIVGEKARLTSEQNRTDILRELSRHEAGYHSDMHSQHPVSTEYLEHLDFRSGAVEFEARERQGLDDVRRITGLPVVCYGQAGYSWAPQPYAALKKWGVPVYLDDHDQISLDGKPFWYGGLLNFTSLTATVKTSFREGGMEKAKQQFDRFYEELSDEQIGFISIYCHECDFVCSGFWDAVNFARGQQTPREQWQPAPLRPAGEMEYWLERFGEFIDYTRSKEHVEYITAEQALALEQSQPDTVSEAHVRALAATVGGDLSFRVLDGKSYSAAELHSLFRSLLLGRELTAEFGYGPEREVESERAGALQVSAIKQALTASTDPDVFGFRQLPDYYTVDGFKINPVDMACTMARIIDRNMRDDDQVEIVRGELSAQKHAGDNDLWGPRWRIFPEHFRAPNVVRLSKLQTWTLKPALFNAATIRL